MTSKDQSATIKPTEPREVSRDSNQQPSKRADGDAIDQQGRDRGNPKHLPPEEDEIKDATSDDSESDSEDGDEELPPGFAPRGKLTAPVSGGGSKPPTKPRPPRSQPEVLGSATAKAQKQTYLK